MINKELNGIAPCAWGPALWHSLHSISFGYPKFVGNSFEERLLKENKYNFFKSLGYVLPCPECSKHYIEGFEKHSDDLIRALDSRDLLAKWVYDLHNRVNKGLDKPESTWPSFEQVYKKYDSLRAENCGHSEESLEGVCSGGLDELYCKVELVPKYEYLNNSQGTHIPIGDVDNNYVWITHKRLSIYIVTAANLVA